MLRMSGRKQQVRCRTVVAFAVWATWAVGSACAATAKGPTSSVEAGFVEGERVEAGVLDGGLQSRLETLAKQHHGRVALYARDLATGREVAIAADTPVQTASVIKLAILLEAMEEVRAGRAAWEEKITLRPGDAVSGSGVLTFFDTPLVLTLKDVLSMMVIVSDNTATNLMIDRFGVDRVNARLTAMGLKDTHLYKKIGKPATEPMPADQPRFGLGKTTPREMARVMERIGRCDLLEPGETATEATRQRDGKICEVALHMLRNQFYRTTIPRFVDRMDSTESGSAIASKTGSLDAVRNDVAIVAGKNGPMVLSIFTYGNEDQGWTVDNEAELMIARLAQEIVTSWSPSGIDGKLLVPGLGRPIDAGSGAQGTDGARGASK